MEKEGTQEEIVRENSGSWAVRDLPHSDLTFRDDQHDFYWLLDALRISRQKDGARFRLVDTGVFDADQLKDLISGGADLYTSDRERKSSNELSFLLKASAKSRAVIAYFFHGDLPEKDGEGNLDLNSLSRLGRDGLIIHISNREKARKVSDLYLLAARCRTGSGRLVYYHHGPLAQELSDLGKERVWIHVSEKSFQAEEDQLFFLDMVTSSRASGGSVILHVESGMDIEILEDAISAGAVVLFKTAPKDFRSTLRPLEAKAGKKKRDFKAFYLSSAFLP